MDQWWPYVVGYIERWVEIDGTQSPNEILDLLRSAKAQLWCFCVDDEPKGIMVTRVEKSDSRRWGLIWGGAGALVEHKKEARAFLDVIEEWFKSLGCEFVEIDGRSGWQRMLPDYQFHSITLRKRLHV